MPDDDMAVGQKYVVLYCDRAADGDTVPDAAITHNRIARYLVSDRRTANQQRGAEEKSRKQFHVSFSTAEEILDADGSIYTGKLESDSFIAQ